jgi:hypothetical protein
MGFLPDLMVLALESEEPISKKELYYGDDYSMQITIKNTIKRLEGLIEK